MKRFAVFFGLVALVLSFTLVPAGNNVGAQEDGDNPSPPLKYPTGGKASKINPALEKLSDDYKSYVGRNAGNAGDFKSSDSFMPDSNGWVTIDAVAATDSTALKADLEKLGLRDGAAFGRMVSGKFPIAAIESLQNADSLNSVRPAYMTTSTGLVTSQGDQSMKSDVARSMFGLDGTGVTVGTLSDSFDCLGAAAADVASGDLPGGSLLLQETGDCPNSTDEGRAIMQLIHDVAPGSTQWFHTADGGQAVFAQGIIDLKNAGANVIVDDVIYFAEPMFQDGVIARAVDTVVAASSSYFSSAGNNSRDAYESAFVPSGQFPFGGIGCPSCEPHNFGGNDIFQRITLPPGTGVLFVLQWDEPIRDSTTGSPGSANDLDLVFFDDPPNTFVGACAANNIGTDPVEICELSNNGGTAASFNMSIAKFTGSAPGLIKVVRFESGSGIVVNHDTNSGTIYGHACAAGAEAVGAAFYGDTPAFGQTPPLLEPFSSAGPCPILFDTNGTRKSSPEIRQKPEVVGPDGTDTTFFDGPDPEGNNFPNFFGTSAAAPHVAAGAALIKQAFPPTSGPNIYSALEANALDMNVAGFDLDTGFGLVQIDQTLLDLDTVPPETSIQSPPPDPDTNLSPSFDFSGTDNLSLESNLIFECQVDGGGFSSCDSGDTLGPLADGSHTFDVKATDEAGNVDPTPASHSWTIATVVPLACGDTITVDTTLTADLNCTGPGLTIGADNITLDLNGFTIFGLSSPCSFNVSPFCPVEAGVLVEGRTGVTITNGTIDGFVNGIWLELNSNGNFVNNIASNNNILAGILLNEDSDENQVNFNTLNGNGLDGITLRAGSDNNPVHDNTATGNLRHGIQITRDSHGNDVHHNTLAGNQRRGVNATRNADGNFIHHNTITDSVESGLAILRGSDGNEVNNNIVQNSGQDGLLVRLPNNLDPDNPQYNTEPENNIITDNTIQGSGTDFNDITDETTDSGTLGTANTYTGNICDTSSPVGLCVPTTLEFVPTPVTIPVTGSGSVDLFVRGFTDPAGLKSYDVTFTYDPSVIDVISNQGGDAPFSLPNCVIDDLLGQVSCNGSQAGIPGPTGDIRIVGFGIESTGVTAATSPLTFTAVQLVDTSDADVTAVGLNGEVLVLPVTQAEPSFNLHQDSDDGATGLKVDISRVYDPVTNNDEPLPLGGFQARMDYLGTCVNILDIRELDFSITASNISNTVGVSTFNGISTEGTLAPVDLGLALTRLVGSNQIPCDITMAITDLTDVNGNGEAVVPPTVSQTLLRGDARADGKISIADALFIAQYLVGLRDACTVVVDTTCLHSANAASVRHDGAFDEKTIADALFIAQYLVDLKDEFYNPVTP